MGHLTNPRGPRSVHISAKKDAEDVWIDRRSVKYDEQSGNNFSHMGCQEQFPLPGRLAGRLCHCCRPLRRA